MANPNPQLTQEEMKALTHEPSLNKLWEYAMQTNNDSVEKGYRTINALSLLILALIRRIRTTDQKFNSIINMLKSAENDASRLSDALRKHTRKKGFLLFWDINSEQEDAALGKHFQRLQEDYGTDVLTLDVLEQAVGLVPKKED